MDQTFYTLVSNFLNKEIRLPNHINIAHAANPLHVIHAIKSLNSKSLSKGRPGDNITPNPTPIMHSKSDVAAMRYKHWESPETKI